jgi:transmembrane E3 ubiquitin-protein ligase
MSAAPTQATLDRGGGGEAEGTDPNDPRPRRSSVTSLLILSLFVFMMTNNGSNDDLAVRNQYKDSLASLEWQFGNYSAWLNGSDTTNFVMVRSFGSLVLCLT